MKYIETIVKGIYSFNIFKIVSKTDGFDYLYVCQKAKEQLCP